jgi:hypothetical protein
MTRRRCQLLILLALLGTVGCERSGGVATRSAGPTSVPTASPRNTPPIDICGIVADSGAFRTIGVRTCTNEGAEPSDPDEEPDDWADGRAVRRDWASIQTVDGGHLSLEVVTCVTPESCEGLAAEDLYKLRESSDAPPGASRFWTGTDQRFLGTRALVGEHIVSGLSVEAGVDAATQRELIAAVIDSL